MTKKYYVNKKEQPNGDHEVHSSECRYLPNEENRDYLGEFNSCEDAVRQAKRKYPNSNGCYFCCNPCHTS